MTTGRERHLVTASHRQNWLRRLWRYGPAVVWIALIFWASTAQFSSENTAQVIQPWLVWLFPNMSVDTQNGVHDFIRKSAHVTEYAIFAMLVARALISSSRPWLAQGWFVVCCLLLAAVAATDEYHQSFVPSRTAAVKDVLIDMSGGLAALTVVALFRHWRRKRAARRQRLSFNRVDGSY